VAVNDAWDVGVAVAAAASLQFNITDVSWHLGSYWWALYGLASIGD